MSNYTTLESFLTFSVLQEIDKDNYHAGYTLLTKAMPQATMTPHNQTICSKLYDPPTSYHSHHRATKTSPPPLVISQEILLKALQQTKPGTAASPLADFPQVLKDFARLY
jgi:hypothetical protein